MIRVSFFSSRRFLCSTLLTFWTLLFSVLGCLEVSRFLVTSLALLASLSRLMGRITPTWSLMNSASRVELSSWSSCSPDSEISTLSLEPGLSLKA